MMFCSVTWLKIGFGCMPSDEPSELGMFLAAGGPVLRYYVGFCPYICSCSYA